jgi:hypothetical protein
MKFKFLLVLIGVIIYGLPFLFFGVFSLATDKPDYSGFPMTYKIEGCSFGCPSTEAGQPGKLYGFYPISLVVDIAFLLGILGSAYLIGNKFETSSIKNKLLISVLFVIGIFAASFTLLLFNQHLPEPAIVPI